jgi:hypothetical protein
MTLSHRDLVRRFEDGATSGESNSMSIADLGDGWTALMGYGHAAYLVRNPQGTIVKFAGWHFKAPGGHSGSMTTKSSHFPAFRTLGEITVAYSKDRTTSERHLKANADVVTDEHRFSAPKRRNAKKAFERALVESGAEGVYLQAKGKA